MRKQILFSLTSLLLMLFPAMASASFSPDRQTFSCENQVTEDCPGPGFVTFNSFIRSPIPDAPPNGDERDFFGVKDSFSASTQTGFSDSINVTDGQRLMLRVYIHNDANPNTTGVDTTAHNTTVAVQLPTSAATSATATASITADNATPRTISDTASFGGSAPFTLSLDRSSPVNLTTRTDDGNGDFATSQINNAFTVFNDNGFTVNLGDWQGGFKHHGTLTFMVLAHSSTVTTTQTAFACTGLARNTTNNVLTATTNSQAAGANITSYNFVVKDSNGNIVNSSTVDTNASSATFNFNQTQPGTYTVTAVANSDKGSTSTSTCTQQITVAQPAVLSTMTSTTTTTPAAATTLPNTGAGDILGVFTGTSALGAIGHYVLRRRQ